MHRLVNRIFQVTDKKKPLLLGSGNGSFGGSGGKGEKSVPVKETIRCIRSSFKRWNRQGGLYDCVDEYYTTQKCHRCYSQTTKVYKADGKVNLDVRHCANCAKVKNDRGLRNRDLNASKNILLVFRCLLTGVSRPSYLKRPCNKSKNIDFSSILKDSSDTSLCHLKVLPVG